jgi:anti-sigma factor RsiW
MMSCRQLSELITDYLDDRLGLADQVRFQVHLGICVHCRAYLRQLKATAGALREVQAEPPPPEVEAELLRRFQGWKQRKSG